MTYKIAPQIVQDIMAATLLLLGDIDINDLEEETYVFSSLIFSYDLIFFHRKPSIVF